MMTIAFRLASRTQLRPVTTTVSVSCFRRGHRHGSQSRNFSPSAHSRSAELPLHATFCTVPRGAHASVPPFRTAVRGPSLPVTDAQSRTGFLSLSPFVNCVLRPAEIICNLTGDKCRLVRRLPAMKFSNVHCHKSGSPARVDGQSKGRATNSSSDRSRPRCRSNVVREFENSTPAKSLACTRSWSLLGRKRTKSERRPSKRWRTSERQKGVE